ncbi:hypothetical protein FLL45_08240 [Aliikangiella marina]|uniref:Uncharacterized protein n=1 Tax=Aliikangiella marina TaxID=1712262 RepID=A0A545TCJ2_9GAMM|nr:hypothetical protein [Aliikangiella marina]TQV74938.1 hypothetical protein FLL45_08240 [Aliikangiella marina]
MKKLFGLVLIFNCFLLTPLHASEERHIHVNGEHLDRQDIVLMDQLFGKTVANGFYWINFQTGHWGLEANDEPLGVIEVIRQNYLQQVAQQSQSNEAKPEINMSQNGRVVSGKLNGQECTFVSVGGTTVKSCD